MAKLFRVDDLFDAILDVYIRCVIMIDGVLKD